MLIFSLSLKLFFWVPLISFALTLLMKYAVVGEKEMTNKTVNVRTRDNVVHGEKTVQQLIDHMTKLKAQRAINDDSSEF